jgi:hypothetical protein
MPWIRREWIGAIAAGTAVIVSCASLYVAWRQSQVMERQLAASVWPSIEYNTGNSEDGRKVITLALHNGGIGPARIRSFHLTYQGVAMQANDFMAACCGGPVENTMTAPVIGRVLSANDSLPFLALEHTADNDAVWNKLNQARFHVGGTVCYCSAVEECWSLDMTTHDPRRVAQCD